MDRARQNIKFFKFLTMLADIFIIWLSIELAVYLRFFTAGGLDAGIESTIQWFIPIICITTVILLYVYGLYSILSKGIYEIFLSVAIIVLINTVLTMALTFFLRGFNFPRTIVFFGAFFQFIFISLFRVLVLKVRIRLHGKKTLLIIGERKEYEEIAAKVLRNSGDLYTVKYCISVQDNFKTIKKLIKEVDFVTLCPGLDNESREKIFMYCMINNTDVFITPTLFDISMKNSLLHQFDDRPTFRIHGIGLTAEQKLIKRLFDIVVSLIAIIVFSPILLIVAAAVKFSSEGPVIFKQERITENNKVYYVYKFRTMVKDAEKLTGPVLATDKDPRITPVGDILRLTRLDELPQFFNVLLGDMSIVGPRPERRYFIDQFKKDLPEFEYRIAVKAGITGLAQVLGKYTTTPSDKLIYDLLYIKNYSFGTDMKILFQTVKIAFIRTSSEGTKDQEDYISFLKSYGYRLKISGGYCEFVKIKGWS